MDHLPTQAGATITSEMLEVWGVWEDFLLLGYGGYWGGGGPFGAGGNINMLAMYGAIALPGAGGGGSGGHVSAFAEDTVIALKAMEAAIAQQEELLSREDMLMECEYRPRPTPIAVLAAAARENNGHEDDGNLDGQHQQQQDELVSWKLTSHAASLQINKMLCQSLYYAVVNSDGKQLHL